MKNRFHYEAADPMVAAIYQKALELSFDWFHIKVQNIKQIGWRFAHNQLTRENLHKEQILLHFHGIFNLRQGSFILPFQNLPKILRKLEDFQQDLILQAPDEELIIPRHLSHESKITWDRKNKSIFETIIDHEIVAGISKQFEVLVKKNIRLTGFLEIAETEQTSLYFNTKETNSLFVHTQEAGGTVSITLDNPELDFYSRPSVGGIATSKQTLSNVTSSEIARTILDSIEECLEHLKLSKLTTANVTNSFNNCPTPKPKALKPDRYDVILHPHATFEFLQTLFMYNLFDRRKIDEGRTYLSLPHAVKTFPMGLVLERTFVLPDYQDKNTDLVDFPLDANGEPMNSLVLISGGHLRDTMVTPYWAKKTGLIPTFGPYQGPPLHLNFVCQSAVSETPPHQMTLAQDLNQLIESTENGLYIAHFWYLRIVSEMDGIMTGMTRDGLFKIENGKITEPVMNMRWHANPFQILSQITGITRKKRLFGLSRHLGLNRSSLSMIPGIRVKNFPFTSSSTF